MRKELARIFRRYRLLFGVLTLVVVVIRVPLVPYSPDCFDHRTGWTNLDSIFLAPAFREEFTAWLRLWEVPYITLDGLVLVRIRNWLGDRDDLLINAAGKAFFTLVDEDWGADVASQPPHVRELIARSHDRWGWVERNCDLVRAVAIDGW